MKTGLLLSGGMDSTALAWWKKPDAAYTIDYGQLAAEAEISASAAVCAALDIPHHLVRVDCQFLGSGDMAGKAALGAAPESDWWPFRNQLLITLLAMRALSHGVSRILIGTVKSDQNHLDGTVGFIQAMNTLLQSQEGHIVLEAPAILLSTSELIRASGVPPAILAWSHSCHKADIPCGNCRGCNKYFHTYREVGYDLDRPG